MSFRETLHIFKGVFGIARSIVRANRRKAYALRHQHAGVRNHAVDHRFDIAAMVADEDDDRAFFARNIVQCVSLAISGRKPKLRRLRIENDLYSCCRHIAPPCAPNIYSRPANHIGFPPKGDLSETCWICREGPNSAPVAILRMSAYLKVLRLTCRTSAARVWLEFASRSLAEPTTHASSNPARRKASRSAALSA